MAVFCEPVCTSTKEKLQKLLKVVVYVGVPYGVLKVIEVLLGFDGFAEYSPILNILAYACEVVLKKDE